MKPEQDKNKINWNQISPPEYEEQIAFHKDTGSMLMTAGPSGAGKTHIGIDCGTRLGYDEVWVSNASGLGPVEWTGYGVPGKPIEVNGKTVVVMHFSQPEGIPTIERVGAQHILWIHDEVGNWDSEIRAANHGVYSAPAGTERKIGQHIIGPNVVVMGTTNRRCDGTSVGKFHRPEVGRWTLCQLVPDPGAWHKWADAKPAYSSTHVPAFIAYSASAGADAGLKSHFMANPEEFIELNPEAQPCPRQWEEVMKAMAFKDNHSKNALRVYIQGRVGEKAMLALRSFLGIVHQLPDVVDMQKNAKTFNPPDETSQQFLLMSAALVFAKKDVQDVHAALHGGHFDWILDTLPRFNPEVAAYGVDSAIRRGIKLGERDSTVVSRYLS